MDAILGRDSRMMDKIGDALKAVEASFIGLIGTPVPSVIGTDFRALKRMAERRFGLPVIAVDTNGMIVRGCEECRKMTQVTAAALSGGVMQNLLLLGMCEKGLAEKGFQVLEHSLTPANDGGIALGQAAVAMEKMKGE